MALTRLGDLIEQCDTRNSDGYYTVHDVRGLSIQKVFIPTKADMKGVSLSPYKVVRPDEFAYVTVTSRNSEKITLAHNTTDDTYIVSSSYVVFRVRDTKEVLPEYLYMYFNRPEFDRYSRFNSWGSARETFDWADFCDIEIDLPPVHVQHKYVDIYRAMMANQTIYEQGLEDLRLLCELELDKIKQTAPRIQTGDLLESLDRRNENEKLSTVMGINITKQFMPSVAKVANKSLRKYKVIHHGEFAYSSMQTGRDETIRIALNLEEDPVLVSPAYDILRVKDESTLPEYVMLWFSRKESDRYGWFASDASIRANLDLSRFFEIEIPLPELSIQRSIVALYRAYLLRREVNEHLKMQTRNLCPVLIKGSLQETHSLEKNQVLVGAHALVEIA